MKLLSRLGGFHRLAIHVLVLLACLAFLAPRADAQTGIGALSPYLGKPVNIPDANLRAIVEDSIPPAMVFPTGLRQPKSITIPTVGTVTTVTLAALTSLDASQAALTGLADATNPSRSAASKPLIDASKPITDLTGLEHATGLVSLDLSGHDISTLTALSSLTKLKFLNLSGNNIVSPGALTNMVQLQLLNLSANNIKTIEHLSKLTNLVRLDLSDNSLVSFAGIENMTNLTHLYLGNSYDITYPDNPHIFRWVRLDPPGVTDFGPLRTLLGKDGVSLQTDMLVVKSLVFGDEPTTSYGAGDSVEIDVEFYNLPMEYRATSKLLEDYTSGEKPYFRLDFGFNSDHGTNIYGSAEWASAAVDDDSQITTVSFSYIVPQRQSADSIVLNDFKVPDDTRITYTYQLMLDFPLQLDAPDDTFATVVGHRQTLVLPPNTPTGKPIRASGPYFTSTDPEPIPESTAANTTFHTLVARDDDGDTITYTITGGADRAAFTIANTNGLQLASMLNFESPTDVQTTDGDGNPTSKNPAGNNEYVVVVQASSGTRPDTVEQWITVTITDANEPPAAPAAPTVTGNITLRPNELDVSWTEPSSPDHPITDYDVRYRVNGTTGDFTEADHTGAGTSKTLENLTSGTEYEVQVLARNAEGDSPWSSSGTGTTAVNNLPSFDGLQRDATESYFDVPLVENQPDVIEVLMGNDDDDDDSVTGFTLSTAEPDAQWFEIDQGGLWVKRGVILDFENSVDELVPGADDNDPNDPGDDGNNKYVIFLTVTSGTGNRILSTTEKFVIRVTDENEKPPIPIVGNEFASGVPNQPTHLTVSWTAPEVPDSIPAIESYEVQYRGEGHGWRGANVIYPDTRTEASATITELIAGGTYNVQVRARNHEGLSDWAGNENAEWMTANNAPLTFTTSQTTFSVTENTPITTPVTTITATDADEQDAVVYALDEEADHAAFEIDAATGVLRFKNVPDFENPADTAVEEMEDPSRNSPAGDNVYIVAVTATSGAGARALDETLWLTITVTDVIEYDNTPPVVEQLTFASPPSGGYTLGSAILVEVTFDDDGVDIPAGVAQAERPFVTLYLGEATAANRRRAYWQGRRDGNSTIVTFAYEVQAEDFATQITIDEELGITVPPDVPIRNSAGVAAETTSVPDGGASVRGQEQVRIEFPDVAPQRGGGTQPGAAPRTAPPLTLTQEVFVSGTPVFIPETVDGRYAVSAVPRTPLVFNEFGNGSGDSNDWLELRNVTGSAVSLKDWELSVVQDGEKKDTSLIVFADVSVPANGVLLVTNQPSDKTPLAGGVKKGLSHASLVDAGLSLPDDGKFLLILRNATEKLGKNEAFVDVAGGGGSDTDAFIRERTGLYDTHVWPLQVLQAPDGDTAEALGSGQVWQRAKADIVGYHKEAWAAAAFTGLGYDRKVTQSPATSGTPGYPNGAAKATVATPKGSVTISELMFASGGGTLPQWIELYNRSKTEVLNLNRWKLEIQNINSAALVGRPIVTLTLGEQLLQPNQTVLIVAGDARASSRSHLPADRVYNLFALHQKNLRVKTPRDTFLSADGFTLKLTDRDGTLVDEVGNTDGNRRTNDAPAWALPVSPEEGVRSSLVRRYDKGVARNGKERASWVLAANIGAIDGALYYGHATDLGTPGWREGGALPVELSRFSVSRTDAGAVVLTWQTESEVENAGFNLRRSERRAGDFTLINPALIAGAGTTGERQTYTFTDTSAKPGVEYYYQLEEVSFAGKPQTLAMRFLRGPVSAANRQLRTFGEVKKGK